ncbi:MAG: exodeoxyribonuclease V subunit alpha [Colwelliaceae bacterium]|nr:exodeoxyribonuclease V subunit alpha [Colwelliaceae bacterium]
MINTESMQNLHLPYQRFVDAQKQLVNIEAIDYFFAKQFSEIFLLKPKLGKSFTHYQSDCLFHLLVALSVSLREGHSCLPIKIIAGQRFGFSSDPSGIVSHQGFHFSSVEELNVLLREVELEKENQQAIVFENGNLYLRRYYQFEQQVQAFIQHHQNKIFRDDGSDSVKTHSIEKITDCLTRLFPNSSNTNSQEVDWQKVAVANALNKSFSIIAGGPGTGKTYTVTKLLAAIIMLNSDKTLHFSLVAPTGKAAQRLSESISQAKAGFKSLLSDDILKKIPTDTQTIHRLLGVIPNTPKFRHNQDNLLKSDILLIDEASMVDLPLMARILKALPLSCQVILLGDSQQLPSVAAGSILSDFTPLEKAQYSSDNQKYLATVTKISGLPSNKKVSIDHLTYLTQSRRFDGKGGIGILSQSVINGDSENSWTLLQQAKENIIPQLMFVEENLGLSAWFKSLVKQYYSPLRHAKTVEEAFDLLLKFRFLSATRKGEVGVETINQEIESLIMPNKGINNALYHAKPIMINENDYALGLYNGDIGLIWQNESGHLMAMFEQQDGSFKSILPSRLPQFETVYAMTIHKTQGSEFEHVAMILPTNTDNQLLTRELLYTGITRAKKQLTIQSKKSVWSQGVESKVLRHSGIELT